jgi:protein O-GlcNAc transferase
MHKQTDRVARRAERLERIIEWLDEEGVAGSIVGKVAKVLGLGNGEPVLTLLKRYTNHKKRLDYSVHLVADNPEIMILIRNTSRAVDCWKLSRTGTVELSSHSGLDDKPYLSEFELQPFDETLRFFESMARTSHKAVANKDNNAEALNNRGVVLNKLKRHEEALASYDRALAINPFFTEALNNRGNVLQKLRRFEQALASYDRALTIKSAYANAMIGRATVLQELKRYEDALVSYDKALAIQPSSALAHYGRGTVLQELNRRIEALDSYDKALAIRPDYAEAHYGRGNILQDLWHYEAAIASYQKALAIRPDYIEAIYNRAGALQSLARYEEALADYEHLLKTDPDYPYAIGALAAVARHTCDWTRTADLADKLKMHILEEKSAVDPLTLLGYFDDPALQLRTARHYAQKSVQKPPKLMWKSGRWRNDKIRIAYLSPDLRRHAVGYQLAELIERHDRTRFEVHAVSYGQDDGSDIRARLVRAFDQFHDVLALGDRDIAKLLCDLHVDVAIDLAGYTLGSRPGILAHRPAPIQVNFLGYSATSGADFIDYLIADEMVVPFEQQPFFTERIVHLPNCYLVNDSTRKIAAGAPTRAEAGLPSDGFVFCCFNNPFKIAAPVFNVWMRLLEAMPGSVLWLSKASDIASNNLRREAHARGIDPTRLVFAPKLDRIEDHLARHRLAGLFLDTLPYNAHTTACDALWAGVPVVTCCGEAFAGRVATSLLHAVGLPDLVTHSLHDYEILARRLASEKSVLSEFRSALERNRFTAPLFDIDQVRRSLEAAYTQMWEIWQRGEKPQSFAVPS